MKIGIRNAGTGDVDFLEYLENQSFPDFQRTARKNILHGIKSGFQEVLIAEDGANLPLGAIVLFKYRRALRIYSISILPEHRGRGVGQCLVKHAIDLANRLQLGRILLEARATDHRLIAWYATFGFRKTGTIADYYCPGEHAAKMEKQVSAIADDLKQMNVIVINQPIKWAFDDSNTKVISVKEYISNPLYCDNSDFRIFNLCSSYKYQSYGYYVSLLASARGQRCIPSSVTIRDFNIKGVIHSVAYDIEELIQKSLSKIGQSCFLLRVYFGQSATKGFSALAMKLYQLFEAPLMEVSFIKHSN